MTVIKTTQGGLVIHSAIELPEAQWKELESLGPVEAVVIPNCFHDSEAPVYAKRFPAAEVFAPESLLTKTRARCPKSKVRNLEREWNSSPWGKEITCIPIQGLRLAGESLFFHPASRTLVICDMAFNMNPDKFKGFERRLMRWNRIGLGFGPSRLATSFFIKNKKLAGESFSQIAVLDFDRVIVNHGDIIGTGGKLAFSAAFHLFLH
jgi:hypothetical protein